PELPRCDGCGHLLRPGVVWFGESLPQDTWRAAETAVRSAGVLLVIGTSAVVYPAAGLVRLAGRHGGRVLEIHLEPPLVSDLVDLALYGKAGDLLPEILARLDAGGDDGVTRSGNPQAT